MPDINLSDVSFCTAKSVYNYIHLWSYTPNKFLLHRLGTEEELYLGVELEVAVGGKDDEKAKYVCNYMNNKTENVYCKSDSSVNDGFEIVTHPCTLEYHRQLEYKHLFNYLIKNKYRSHNTNTCGMHVHINRSYFGDDKLTRDLCISKLLYLFEKHWEKVELIARRPSNRFARRFLLEENETPIDLYAKSKSSNKYGAINLMHSDTVEIRIFRGTLNYITYISTLEFVSIMAKIAKETDIYEIQFVTWDKVKSMFSSELNEYISHREKIKSKIVNDSYGLVGYRSINNRNERIETAYPDARWIVAPECISFIDQSLDLSCDTFSNISIGNEITEEEQIRRMITNLRSRVRRCRNGFEEINLNRQIANLENKLRLLRREIG